MAINVAVFFKKGLNPFAQLIERDPKIADHWPDWNQSAFLKMQPDLLSLATLAVTLQAPYYGTKEHR